MQVAAAVADLEACCGLSAACSADCATAGGPAALVQHLRACGRGARNQARTTRIAQVSHVAGCRCPHMLDMRLARGEPHVACCSGLPQSMQFLSMSDMRPAGGALYCQACS